MRRHVLSLVLSERRFRNTAIIIFAAYTAIYLFVTQFLVISVDPGDNPAWSFLIVSNWSELIFRQRAAFLFESIGSVHVTPYLTIFLSIPNLILAFALSTLVALNITVSYYTFHKTGLRGAKGFVTLAGTIPALLGGAACCVPTLILVLGLQFTATLSSVWPWFMPASFVLLFLSLWWALRHASRFNMEEKSIPKPGA